MISLDTNVLLYSLNETCPEFPVAYDVVSALAASTDVVIAELVLVELYLLLRNPTVVAAPLSAPDAAAICQGYRRNPRWRLVDGAPVMDEVWRRAARPRVNRRHLIDARLALTLRHHGVTELVTRNTRDFDGFGFTRLTNPFD